MAINPGFVPINGTLNTIDFFGTVRGRLGYAFDRTLVYATGGFAYATGTDDGARVGLQNFAGRRNDFKTGWTVGGGFEYALPTDSFLNFFRSSAVTLKVEGLYVNLDNNSNRAQLPLVGAAIAPGRPGAGLLAHQRQPERERLRRRPRRPELQVRLVLRPDDGIPGFEPGIS